MQAGRSRALAALAEAAAAEVDASARAEWAWPTYSGTKARMRHNARVVNAVEDELRLNLFVNH
ncbi:hypothetical protein BURKHO8Y_70153 [Burkholderia sp. 8Y]|nr:hypothetical protein BURKHO8Y_70153 [Burkholderia sp. 8Y]